MNTIFMSDSPPAVRTLSAIGLLVLLGIVLIGMAAGVGGYTFIYAKGYSYLSNDPAACANCHIMNEQFNGWQASTHKNFATCNDCHTPHDFFGKYLTKAINGFNHSLYFTLGGFPEPIRITERNKKITENACRNCHGAMTEGIDPAGVYHDQKSSVECASCHSSVGHLHSY